MSIILGYILLMIFTATLMISILAYYEASKYARINFIIITWSAILALIMFVGICYYNFSEKEVIEKRLEVIDGYVDFNGDGHLYKVTHNENKKFGKTAIFRKLKYQRYGIFYPQKDYWY